MKVRVESPVRSWVKRFWFFIALLLAISPLAAVVMRGSMPPGGSGPENGRKENAIPDASRETGGEAPKARTAELGNAEWGLSLQDGKVVMDEYNFIRWLEEVYERLDLYEGTEIETSGFVFRTDEFLQEQFVAARLMMVCCAADAQTVGFLCAYEEAPDLPGGAWVKVSGNITRVRYNGQVIPLIEVEQVLPLEKPDNEYVYPPQ